MPTRRSPDRSDCESDSAAAIDAENVGRDGKLQMTSRVSRFSQAQLCDAETARVSIKGAKY
jgi:hypothetical protein